METPSVPDKNDPKNCWTPEDTIKYLGACVRTLYNLRANKEVDWGRKRGTIRYLGPHVIGICEEYPK